MSTFYDWSNLHYFSNKQQVSKYDKVGDIDKLLTKLKLQLSYDLYRLEVDEVILDMEEEVMVVVGVQYPYNILPQMNNEEHKRISWFILTIKNFRLSVWWNWKLEERETNYRETGNY